MYGLCSVTCIVLLAVFWCAMCKCFFLLALIVMFLMCFSLDVVNECSVVARFCSGITCVFCVGCSYWVIRICFCCTLIHVFAFVTVLFASAVVCYNCLWRTCFVYVACVLV